MKEITILEPNTIINESNEGPLTKRKVCGYARVSTDKDEQFSSYESQVEYYKEYIESNPNYIFVGMYTDEGITGTSIKKRPGFQKMINDAISGNIDLIVTKSISRFARNTVDSLTTIRLLKEHNVECYFEKENIYTFDSKGELLITIMSSIAQEESRSISLNVTWGIQRRMAKGIVVIPASNMLGFTKLDKGSFDVCRDDIWIVKSIFYQYLDGYSFYDIAKELTNEKIPTPMHKDKWYGSTIKSILSNEKYVGDAVLQKTYTSDFLTKKKMENTGKLTKYYIKNHHEPIVDRSIFNLVNNQINSDMNRRDSRKINCLLQKIYCPYCGMQYIKKTSHPRTSYAKELYTCLGRMRKRCISSIYFEDFDFIEDAYETQFKSFLLDDKNKYELLDLASISKSTRWLNKELYDLLDLKDKSVLVNNRIASITNEINKRNNSYSIIKQIVLNSDYRYNLMNCSLVVEKIYIYDKDEVIISFR